MAGQKDRPGWDKMSRIQSDALVSLLADADLDPTARADISVLLSTISWHNDGDGIRVMDALVAPTRPQAKKRRGMQDFRKVANYLSADAWQLLSVIVFTCT